MTKKELKRFKIAPNDECFFCKRPDSLEHAFLECSAANNFFCECLLWFNNEHHTDFILPSQQLLLKDYNLPPETNPILSRKFDIFVVSSQKYFYSCKMIQKRSKKLMNSSKKLQYNGESKNAELLQHTEDSSLECASVYCPLLCC